MAEFYTNLPPKEKDSLEKTIETLTTTNYQTNYQFNTGEYDAVIAFFVKRGFKRESWYFTESYSKSNSSCEDSDIIGWWDNPVR